jgi:hypothetical protein
LSGHIVQGHVDGTGEFLSLESLGDENWWLRIRVPAELDPFLVYKGSIAIDGISLTIAALESDVLSSPSFRTPTATPRWAATAPARASIWSATSWPSTWKNYSLEIHYKVVLISD